MYFWIKKLRRGAEGAAPQQSFHTVLTPTDKLEPTKSAI